MEKKEKKPVEKFKIIHFEGGKIYELSHQADGKSRDINIRNDKGELDIEQFSAYINASMETDMLAEKFRKIRKNGDVQEKFCFKLGRYDVTRAVINVEFKKAERLYDSYIENDMRRIIRFGYSDMPLEYKDHVAILDIDGEPTIVGIEVPFYDKKTKKPNLQKYTPVENPIDEQLLGKYFDYDEENKCYIIKEKESNHIVGFPIVAKNNKIRTELYENGFVCDGIHYVRYKRSAGSSRTGNCLFIIDKLYDDMMEWSNCGLDVSKIKDLASFEAYMALTLSNRIRSIEIPKSSILFMRDKESIFKDKAIVIGNDENGNITAHRDDEFTVSNNIWDGEALLDKSIFDKYDYSKRGMLQLRNQFFKTCAFNTNIQKWFKDEGITKISELNGVTTARSVDEIKMIVTESSLKYIKLLDIDKDDDKGFRDGVKQWLKNTSKIFGVVKTDAPTKYMGGELVRTSYQILNTIGMTRDEVEDLFLPTIDYIEMIKSEPMFLRHYLNYRLDFEGTEDIYEDDDNIEGDVINDQEYNDYRATVIMRMIELSEEFSGTYFYKDFLNQVCKGIKEQLSVGKVLIRGTYCTLFGNGAELLRAATNKNYVVSDSEIKGSNIYTVRFPDGAKLLAYRNPHVTMGNILLTTNQHSDFYEKYFNLTKEIVCVNAIGNNIQHKLNGCDYDSDNMLITDNEVLLKAARRNYDKFLVPVCNVKADKIMYEKTASDRAVLDSKISNNSIGIIIDLSQKLNSILWNEMKKGASDEEIEEIYCNICKLAVLSGLEIDKAKRMFAIKPSKEIEKIIVWRDEKYGDITPKFFNKIKKRKIDRSVVIDTPMEYIYELASKRYACREKITYRPREDRVLDTDMVDLVMGCEINPGSNDYRYKGELIDLVYRTSQAIKSLNIFMQNQSRKQKKHTTDMKRDLLAKMVDGATRIIKNNNIVLLILKELDNKDKKENISSMKSLLFAALCLEKNHRFTDMVTLTRRMPMYNLIPDLEHEEGEEYDDTIDIYGVPHFRQIHIV